jgi:mannosyltransferase OCH1-like enzyme
MIPLIIHTIWHTKNLPEKMNEAIQSIIRENKEFEYRLFDFDDCIELIKNNFNEDVLYACNKLKPAAYKCDLYRYCILYLFGGIYVDIKFIPLNNFKFITLTDKEYFCRDMHVPNTACNGLIICKPRNETILNCIQKIIQHTKTNYYGLGSLCPTGPGLLTNCIDPEEVNRLGELRLSEEIYILYRNNKILMRYPEYREEQSKFQITEHYDKMWRERDIYIFTDK